MKKELFLIAIFCVPKANAQPYLLTFAGIGASTTLSTVKVENLTAGKTLTLNGSDILRLTMTTGVNSIDDGQSPDIKIYPNPMTGNSILQIYPPVAGNSIISVTDMTGKMLTQIQSKLDKGLQEFHLSGLKSGFYLITVMGSTYRYSVKLLSNSKESGSISIEKINNNQTADGKVINADSKGELTSVDMNYTTGDRIKFTGISGNYSTVKIDIPTSDKTITFNFLACTDGDNNNYPVVEIGTQVWMAENLKTTKYLNGDLIGTTNPATLDLSGESTPKYQWAYDGNESNVATYGRLYTWYALTDSRNICPTGWHVFTDPEWVILVNYLAYCGYGGWGSGFNVAKSMAASSGWTTNPTAGNPGNDQASNNISGFTALPGGSRWNSGEFGYIGCNCYFWSSTETSSYKAVYPYLFCGYSGAGRSDGAKASGHSVRCLKNN